MRLVKWDTDDESPSLVVGAWLHGGLAAMGPKSAFGIASAHNAAVDAANAEIERLEKALAERSSSHDACIDRTEALERGRDAARVELAAERKAHEATKAALRTALDNRDIAERELVELQCLRATAPAPLPASVEALLWVGDEGETWVGGLSGISEQGAFAENSSEAKDFIAAHNAAIRQAVELTRKEVAAELEEAREGAKFATDESMAYAKTNETLRDAISKLNNELAQCRKDAAPVDDGVIAKVRDICREWDEHGDSYGAMQAVSLATRPVKPKRWRVRVKEGEAERVITCATEAEARARAAELRAAVTVEEVANDR